MSGMKAKTIQKIIAGQLHSLAASIDDPAVKDIIKKKTIVTGGCITSMLLGEPVNDFDIYFTDESSTKAVADYYVSKFKAMPNGTSRDMSVEHKDGRISIVIQSAGIVSDHSRNTFYPGMDTDLSSTTYVDAVMDNPGQVQDAYEEAEGMAMDAKDDASLPKHRPVFLSTNAITLSGRIQIILRFYGDPDTIHGNYDFVHCTNYYTSLDNKLTLRQPALEATLAKELRYVGSKYPVCSIIRLRKFIKRGWTINAGQILKILMHVSTLNLTDPAVLKDQLTGVDAAYFVQILKLLREKDPIKIDTAYLVEIIDRMF